LCGVYREDLDIRYGACQFQLLERQLVDQVNTTGGERHRLIFLVIVEKVDLIQEHLATPIEKRPAIGRAAHPLEYASVSHTQLGERIGSGAQGMPGEGRSEGGMQD